MNKFFFLLIFVGLVSISVLINHQAFAGTQTNNYIGTSHASGNFISINNFTGIPPAAKIFKAQMNFTGGAGGTVRMKLFDTNGAQVNGTTVHDYRTGGVSLIPALHAQKFINLPVGGNVTYVGGEITSTNGSALIRVKIFSDGGALPGVLLGESNAVTYNNFCFNNFGITYCYYKLINPVLIPNSGILWGAIEASDKVNVKDSFQNVLNIQKRMTHTFGAGPASWNVTGSTNDTFAYALRLNFTTNHPNGPRNLLAETNAITLNGTGLQTFIFNSIPAVQLNGIIWAGWENNGGLLMRASATQPNGTDLYIAHTYGSGPSSVNFLYSDEIGYWMKLFWTDPAHITLTPNHGAGGTNLIVNGSGFGNNKVVNIYFNGVFEASDTTDGSGKFNCGTFCNFAVPNLTPGVYPVNATDSTGVTSLAAFTIPAPTLILNATNVHVYDTVSASGSGFVNNTALQITYDGSVLSTIPAQPVTNSTGGFSGTTFTVPNSVAGHHNVKVIDGYGNNATQILNVTSSVNLVPTSGSVGNTVIFSGFGFNGAHNITVKFDGNTVATSPATITTDSKGTFTGSFVVPSTLAGSHNVVFSDIAHSVTKTFTTTNTPSLTISPTSGAVGSTINLKGDGYNGNSHINFEFNGILIGTNPSPVITNSTGSFSGVSMTVPLLSIGTYGVQALDPSSHFAVQNYTITSIPAGPLQPVLDLHSTSITNHTVSMAWSQPNLGGGVLSGYQINYTTPSGNPETIIINNTHSSGTSFTISGLASSTTYSFRVGVWTTNAFNPNGNIISITTLKDFVPANFTPGNVNLNGTNPVRIGFEFTRLDNGNNTDIVVNYPSSFNPTCNVSYKFAETNKTYSNLSRTPAPNSSVSTTFLFINSTNDIIYLSCNDKATGTTGTYVLTQNSFPIIQQINDFRGGKFGTTGQFGAIDLVTLCAVILAMIGLNRINEAAGIIFTIITIGALAFFHIIQWPSVIVAALAVIVLVAITSHRKIPSI